MRKLFHRLPALLAAAAICLSFLPAGIAQAEENSAAEQFEDVLPGQWYASAIEFVVENGYFNGVSEKSFAPDAPMTRAMFVTVLGRYAGVEDTAQEASDSVFIDVEPGSYYSGYVGWAVENGIVLGFTDTVFGQADFVTREQVAVFLYRYAQLIGLDTSVDSFATPSTFNVGAKISPWAMKAVTWAMSKGIMQGLSGNMDHQAEATRAQVAQILMNFSNFANR